MTAEVDYPGYEALRRVLHDAYLQAAAGKGKERHADAKPFPEQPMLSIARLLGSLAGPAQQVIKKTHEATGMVARDEFPAARAELLGAINYAAGMILLIEEIAAKHKVAFDDLKAVFRATEEAEREAWQTIRKAGAQRAACGAGRIGSSIARHHAEPGALPHERWNEERGVAPARYDPPSETPDAPGLCEDRR